MSSRAETLFFDSHQFAYRDVVLPDGGHVLTLTPLLHEGEKSVLDGCTAEQHVPPPLAGWDEESKDRLVWALAHALFDDVARLVAVDARAS